MQQDKLELWILLSLSFSNLKGNGIVAPINSINLDLYVHLAIYIILLLIRQ